MGDHLAEQTLASAEYFRKRNEIKKAVKFAIASTRLAQSDAMKCLTMYQTGKLYYLHTQNWEEAEQYLEVAYQQMRRMPPETARTYRLDAACMLAEIYVSSRNAGKVNVFIKTELEGDACNHQQFFIRLALICAEGAMIERQTETANALLEQLIVIGNNSRDYVLPLYAAITKLLVSSETRNVLPEGDVIHISNGIMTLTQQHPNFYNLQLYLVTVQLAHYLSNGQDRTAKNLLRGLQNMMSVTKVLPEGLRWADSSYITAMTCLFTQVSSVQHCSVDRSIKYYQLATKNITEYNNKSANRALDASVFFAMRRMRFVADELMAQSNIVACHLEQAIGNIRSMIELTLQYPSLSVDGYPRIHLLLGMLALYMNDEKTAELQFEVAAQESERNREADAQLPVIIALHRTLLYLTQCKFAEFLDLSESIAISRTTHEPPPIRAAIRIVHAFHHYLQNKATECKQHVSEALELTRAEDMFRLHMIAILVCTSLNLGAFNNLAMLDTLRPTMDWSMKARDIPMLSWTNSLIQGMYLRANDGAAAEQHNKTMISLANTLAESQIIASASPGANIIKWLKDDPNDYLPKEELLAHVNVNIA